MLFVRRWCMLWKGWRLTRSSTTRLALSVSSVIKHSGKQSSYTLLTQSSTCTLPSLSHSVFLSSPSLLPNVLLSLTLSSPILSPLPHSLVIHIFLKRQYNIISHAYAHLQYWNIRCSPRQDILQGSLQTALQDEGKL